MFVKFGYLVAPSLSVKARTSTPRRELASLLTGSIPELGREQMRAIVLLAYGKTRNAEVLPNKMVLDLGEENYWQKYQLDRVFESYPE